MSLKADLQLWLASHFVRPLVNAAEPRSVLKQELYRVSTVNQLAIKDVAETLFGVSQSKGSGHRIAESPTGAVTPD